MIVIGLTSFRQFPYCVDHFAMLSTRLTWAKHTAHNNNNSNKKISFILSVCQAIRAEERLELCRNYVNFFETYTKKSILVVFRALVCFLIIKLNNKILLYCRYQWGWMNYCSHFDAYTQTSSSSSRSFSTYTFMPTIIKYFVYVVHGNSVSVSFAPRYFSLNKQINMKRWNGCHKNTSSS